ncbi:tripartite tricarboxylate transporter substrate binding protein [Variovorax sp. LjRoot290]|uniref:tripartite tricarboxylate transporter substrate binding protein n=1 Tax=Variovorax sp. LjRoot290 TaxID=3342316 RepID=UPI003ECC1993
MLRPISAALAMCAVVAFAAQAQVQARADYPSKPVRIIVPFPPGQATDVVARILAEELTKAWGQSVFVDNRAGGASIPGMVAGRDAAADGYTLTMGTVATIAVNPAVHAKLPYAVTDYRLISGVFTMPAVIVANAQSEARTLGDLITASKHAAGGLSWGVAGHASTYHLAGEELASRADMKVNTVAYKGSGPMITDLMAGHIPYAVDSVSSSLSGVRSAKLRPLAVTSAQRVKQLPDVPTVAELGYAGYERVGWGGLIAPRATPEAIVERVSASVQGVLAKPEVSQRISDLGGVVDARGAAAWPRFVEAEIKSVQQTVQRSQIRLE